MGGGGGCSADAVFRLNFRTTTCNVPWRNYRTKRKSREGKRSRAVGAAAKNQSMGMGMSNSVDSGDKPTKR